MSYFDQVIGSVTTPYGDATIHLGRYPSGGAVAVEVSLGSCRDDGWTFSTNVVPYGANLADNEFAVKTWSENELLVEPMRATHLFEDTGRRFPIGYVVAPIWRLRDARHVPPARRRAATTESA